MAEADAGRGAAGGREQGPCTTRVMGGENPDAGHTELGSAAPSQRPCGRLVCPQTHTFQLAMLSCRRWIFRIWLLMRSAVSASFFVRSWYCFIFSSAVVMYLCPGK